MRTSRYTDSQILAILKQNENGVAVPELCREHGMDLTRFSRQIIMSKTKWEKLNERRQIQ